MTLGFTREYTSLSTYPVNFDARPASGGDLLLPRWFQVIGAGTVVIENEDGSTGTFVCVGGEVFSGAVRRLVSSSATRVRVGTGTPPGGGSIVNSTPALVTSVVDGPALTAAAAATCIPAAAKITLPANYFTVGKTLRIRATGRISSLITTPGTARFDVRVGAVVAFDSLAVLLDTVAAHTNVGWSLELLLTCRSVGSGVLATLMGQGVWTCEDILGVPATAPKGVLSAILPWNSAPAVGTGFDSTVANTLDLFFTQTAATGSLTVHQYAVEALN